ncbi:hypothetical protein [Bounagaea algeriensis]
MPLAQHIAAGGRVGEGALLVLATALTVFTDLPGTFWLLAVIKPLLLGCALWLLYECLRNLLATRVHR